MNTDSHDIPIVAKVRVVTLAEFRVMYGSPNKEMGRIDSFRFIKSKAPKPIKTHDIQSDLWRKENKRNKFKRI